MKNKLITMILQFAGKKMDGKKTYAGAAGKILSGIASIIGGMIGILGIAFPDQGLPEFSFEVASGMVAAGFYAVSSGLQGVGIGHKIEKANAAK
jgi:hypothetical protein